MTAFQCAVGSLASTRVAAPASCLGVAVSARWRCRVALHRGQQTRLPTDPRPTKRPGGRHDIAAAQLRERAPKYRVRSLSISAPLESTPRIGQSHARGRRGDDACAGRGVAARCCPAGGRARRTRAGEACPCSRARRCTLESSAGAAPRGKPVPSRSQAGPRSGLAVGGRLRRPATLQPRAVHPCTGSRR